MKKYNTLSQEKFDKFIDSLIDNGKINSKSDFAKLMRLDFQGIYDKEMLNNICVKDIPELIRRLKKFKDIFRSFLIFCYEQTSPLCVPMYAFG